MFIEILTIWKVCSIAGPVLTGAVGAAKIYFHNRQEWIARTVKPDLRNSEMRGNFNTVVIPPPRVTPGHTHGTAAAHRTRASTAMVNFATSQGLKPYFFEMSRKNQNDGHDGSRNYYWAKDLNAQARSDPITDKHVVCMVDVDYYMKDLEHILAGVNRPTLLYTFQPTKAADNCIDYSFTFNKNNEVRYLVAGGGEYKHQVWNFSSDTIVCRRTFLGLTYKKVYYTIEKRKIDDHHQLIFLTPLARCGIMGSIFTAWYLSESNLSYMNVVDGDYARLDVMVTDPHGGKSMKRSTCALGMYNEQTIEVGIDDAIATQAKIADNKLSAFTVKSMKDETNAITDQGAVSLVAYHRQKNPIRAPERVVMPSDSVFHYNFSTATFNEEKPGVIAYMNPIITGCCAPTQSKSNDEAMVQQRIKNVEPKRGGLSNRNKQFAQEFAQHFLRSIDGKQLTPVDYEDVDENLSRPSQRKITEDASWWGKGFKRIVKSFMKKESYGKFAAPRPIATINGNDKVKYSQFTYSLSEALKKMPWYAFGKSPKHIGTRVALLARLSKWLAMTDLSKFDGRVSEAIREFENIFMHTVFESSTHAEMEAMMKTQYNLNAVSNNGYFYRCLFGRLSGSPETAVFNSLVNAFLAYVTYRTQGMTEEEAWTKLGIYGGDDGVSPDADPIIYTKVCKDLGQVLECDIVHFGKMGVNFLARMYGPQVWFGDTSNCCDIKRALQKIHVTPAVALDPKAKLYEKAFALWLTDKNTPVIGKFVQRVVELKQTEAPEAKFENKLNHWWARYTNADDQYVNTNDNLWMDAFLAEQLPNFREREFYEWVASCGNLDRLLLCPKFMDTEMPPPADVDIKVNDDLYRARAPGKVPIAPRGEKPTEPSRPELKEKEVKVKQSNRDNSSKNKNKNKNKDHKSQHAKPQGRGPKWQRTVPKMAPGSIAPQQPFQVSRSSDQPAIPAVVQPQLVTVDDEKYNWADYDN